MQTMLEPLPHREAIAYFRSKGFAPQLQRFSYLDHWREEHARNFVVAKAMQDDVLALIRGELDRALAEGRTLKQFQDDLRPALEKAGWWGKATMVDPLTGELSEVQLGSLRRLRVIYETNMRTAHAAGHWARIERTKTAFPYLHYIQIERSSKRHDHARFHDKIWRVDDPIWRKIYPPNGYFCGCTVIQRTEGWMRRNNRQVSPDLDLEEVEWTNRRTGETSLLPKGVTPGFDTNPGATWLDMRAAWAKIAEDLPDEQRAADLGVLQGLRLRRTGDARDGLAVMTEGMDPVIVTFGEADAAASELLGDFETPLGARIIRTTETDAPISDGDLEFLAAARGASMTRVTSGGTIWRAIVRRGEQLSRLLMQFEARRQRFSAELDQSGHGAEIYAHARLLWLEKLGAISYSWRMSGNVRQIMDAHADLVRRLVDADP